MTRPWLLIASTGVVFGALFGLTGAILFAFAACVVVAMARQPWKLVTVVAAISAAAGVARISLHEVPPVSSDVISSTQAEGVVTSQPQSGPSGPRAVLRVDRARDGDGEWIDASGDVLVLFGDTAPTGVLRGDRLRLTWNVTDLDSYDPGFRRFIESSDAGAGAWALHTTVLDRGDGLSNLLVRLRHTVTNGIQSAIDGDAGVLLAGFVTGDDSGLSEEARDAFERTNTSHITAVSGSNVAVLLSIWYVMMPTQRLRRIPLAMIGVMLLIWAYVILVGFGPGAVRAGLFATILLLAIRFGRRADPLTALAFASALMLMVAPGYADSVGFWLSLAASAAMVTSVTPQRTKLGALKQGVVALIAAQIATLPVTFWVFDGWSPGSFVANLVLGPLVSAIFPVAFVTAVIVTVFPWFADLIGWLPALGANLIIAVVRSMAGEFPMLRSGATPIAGLLLIAILCAAVIAMLSEDARRWVRRVQWSRPLATDLAVPIALGASAGVWIGILAFALLR